MQKWGSFRDIGVRSASHRSAGIMALFEMMKEHQALKLESNQAGEREVSERVAPIKTRDER